jgi:hypothetical protein
MGSSQIRGEQTSPPNYLAQSDNGMSYMFNEKGADGQG